jgi:hypothetical protein
MSGRAVHTPLPADARRRRTVRVRTGVEVLGWVGSLVTLTAMLVLAATAGALADGVPAGGASVTATFER